MTPKEKAEELFDMMLYNNGDEYHHCWDYVAKNCALIAVEEMIIQNGELYLNGLDGNYREKNNFLFEVKNEIEKL
jgi:hypothetical protein